MTEIFKACRVGISVPPGEAVGTVHSVFSRVVNIDFGGGELVSVLAPRVPMAPAGISVEGEDPRLFITNVAGGDECRISGGTLYVSGNVISFGGARRWDSRIGPEHDFRLGGAGPQRQYWDRQIAGHWIFDVDGLSGLMRAAAQRIASAIRDLISGMAELDTARVCRAVRSLSGIGPGLTPSGDDILLGWIFTSRMVRQNDGERKVFGEALRQLMLGRDSASVSDTFLAQAVRGEFSEPLLQLEGALRRRPEGVHRTLLQRIRRTGHFSGQDTLLGCYCGLFRTLPPEKE